MSAAERLFEACSRFIDGKAMYDTGKTAGALVRAYVNKSGKQQNASLTPVEAWKVYYVFFGSKMKQVKPSKLRADECKQAELLLVNAWQMYQAMNVVQEVFTMAMSPSSALEPLGVGDILMKIATVYLESGKMPNRSEIDEFDRKGGLVRQQVRLNFKSYIDILIQVDE